MEKELSAIKKLLTIIVVPLVIYLLNVMDTIFIPLTFGLFFALLFTPILRWFTSKKIPKAIGMIFVLIMMSGIVLGTYKILEMTSSELMAIDEEFIEKFDSKLDELARPVVNFMRIEKEPDESHIAALLNNEKVVSNIVGNIGGGINAAKNFLSVLLMSVFFMALFLAGSVNVQNVLEVLIFKQEEMSRNTYHQIEKGVFTYVLVKVFVSALTGIGISLACYFFGVSFPIFWGVAAFLLNFIQIIGSALLVGILALFAFVELSATGSLVGFIIIIVGVQFIIGNILEPIMLGRSFSINTITVLVMLSIWGIIWGIPGLVLSIPMTAMLKIILEKFPSTQVYAKLMS